MNEDAYVARNLRGSIRYRDIHKVPEFKSKESLFSIANASVSRINSNLIWNGAIERITVKGKDAWSIKDPKAILAHKLLVSNIKSNYSARSQDRKFIIESIISHLKDSYGYCVHRLDIKSFYESFDRREVIRKIKNDSILSKKSINLLESFFKELGSLGVIGLPRGIGISSALSELMMTEFDEKISSLKSVLFYARFVDDILIISTPSLNKSLLMRHAGDFGLPKKIEFHKSGDKISFSQVNKTTDKGDRRKTFDFLGYQFELNNYDNHLGQMLTYKRREVSVSIAPNKVDKIKNRILKSFFSVLSSRRANADEIALLNKRIMFLSKNYLLPNSPKEPNIYSGIYHNYNYVDNYDQLKEIDSFYQNLLFGKSTRLNNRIRCSLSFKTRRGLAKHSFLSGFKNKEFCRFTNSDFNEIKKAWS